MQLQMHITQAYDNDNACMLYIGLNLLCSQLHVLFNVAHSFICNYFHWICWLDAASPQSVDRGGGGVSAHAEIQLPVFSMKLLATYVADTTFVHLAPFANTCKETTY